MTLLITAIACIVADVCINVHDYNNCVAFSITVRIYSGIMNHPGD